MKRLKKSTAFHGSTRIAPPGPGSASRCAVTGTPGRGSPLHSAVVEVRHMAGCLQHPAWRGSPLCGMERGTSVCPHHRIQQDETTLIVARPAQKIKGHRCEISASAVIPRRELRHREPGGRNAKAHGDAAQAMSAARKPGKCRAPRFPVHESGALWLSGVGCQKKEKEKGEQIYSHVVPTGQQWNAAELTPRPAARQSPLRRCGS